MDVVGEAVKQGAGEALAAEDLGPFVEGQVAGDQGRAAFMALGEDLEQQFGAGLRQRHVTDLIDDEQVDLGQRLLVAQQMFLVPGLDQRVHQGGGGGPQDGIAALACRQTQAQGEVALPGAGVAHDDDILAAVDVATRARSSTSGLLTLGILRKLSGHLAASISVNWRSFGPWSMMTMMARSDLGPVRL